MQYSQEHLKTMVYAKFGGQTECIMGNWKIENGHCPNSLNLLIVRYVFHYTSHYDIFFMISYRLRIFA